MTDDSLQQRVLKWIHEHGFPLELRVGRAFQEAGWRISHAQRFTDPVESIVREFDVRATVTAADTTAGRLSLSLAIECKDSRDKPWVVFMGDPDRNMGYELEHFPDGVGQQLILTRYGFPDLAEDEVLGRQVIGHGITTAFKGRDTAFEACLAASSAAIAMAKENETLNLDVGLKVPLFDLWMPVVVTKAPLFGYGVTSDSNDVIQTNATGKGAGQSPKRRTDGRDNSF